MFFSFLYAKLPPKTQTPHYHRHRDADFLCARWQNHQPRMVHLRRALPAGDPFLDDVGHQHPQRRQIQAAALRAGHVHRHLRRKLHAARTQHQHPADKPADLHRPVHMAAKPGGQTAAARIGSLKTSNARFSEAKRIMRLLRNHTPFQHPKHKGTPSC